MVVWADKIRSDYPDYVTCHWVAALAYRDLGGSKKADEVWDDLLTKSSDLYAVAAPGYFYARHTSEETVRRIESLNSDDPLVLAAQAFVLADVPGRRDDAVVQRLSPTLRWKCES